MKRSRYSIRAVERVCDLLDLLEDTPLGVSLADAADVLDLPKPTVFRYLATLEARRYVERLPGGGNYRPGPKFPNRPALPARLREQVPEETENLR